ncbi:MAG TPA: AraC family transcriptional regulator, partial [Mucilaginibacter sp.]
MTNNVMREITPLTPGDCFAILSRVKQKFDFPLHYHEEYELNLILNGKGIKRMVGGHTEVIDDLELALVGPNLNHAWFTHQCQSDEITEVTIQFHKDLFDEKFLKRNQLSFVKSMLEHSQRGILFPVETVQALKDRLLSLDKKTGFESVLELLSILHDLSISRNVRTLSDPGSANEKS